MPHNIDMSLCFFCVLRRTKRLAPLGYHMLIHQLAICHVRALFGHHQTVVNEGVSEELHAEKIINFWCPLNCYVR